MTSNTLYVLAETIKQSSWATLNPTVKGSDLFSLAADANIRTNGMILQELGCRLDIRMNFLTVRDVNQ